MPIPRPFWLATVFLASCMAARAAAPEASGPQFPPLLYDDGQHVAAVPRKMSLGKGPLSDAPLVGRSSGWSVAKQARRILPPSRRVAMAEASGAPLSTATSSAPPATREMLDIEAGMNILVEKVDAAAVELRRLVRGHGGVLIDDRVDQSTYSNARFLIRVDAPATDALLNALASLGQVRNREVIARDVGKEYRDAALELENLKVAMERYEQVLAKADKVADILAIERELTRVRGEIEKVQGNLRWMQDRVARSTIHVNLASARQAAAQEPLAPEAKLHPGLRAVFLEDMRGDNVHQGYLGGGISLRFNRAFSLDVDGLRRTKAGSPTKGLDVFVATLGGETYSEFLGNGARRFANPYLGLRLGYARFLGHSEFALGGTVGLEVVKTRYFGLDLAVRGLGFIGRSAHLAVQPELTASFAF